MGLDDYIWEDLHICGLWKLYQNIRLLIGVTCLAALSALLQACWLPTYTSPRITGRLPMYNCSAPYILLVRVNVPVVLLLTLPHTCYVCVVVTSKTMADILHLGWYQYGVPSLCSYFVLAYRLELKTVTHSLVHHSYCRKEFILKMLCY